MPEPVQQGSMSASMSQNKSIHSSGTSSQSRGSILFLSLVEERREPHLLCPQQGAKSISPIIEEGIEAKLTLHQVQMSHQYSCFHRFVYRAGGCDVSASGSVF